MMWPNPVKILELKALKAQQAEDIRRSKSSLKDEREFQERMEKLKKKEAMIKIQRLEDDYIKRMITKIRMKKIKTQMRDEAVQTLTFKSESKQKHKSTQSMSVIEHLNQSEIRKKASLYPPIMHRNTDKEVMFVHLVSNPQPILKSRVKTQSISSDDSYKTYNRYSGNHYTNEVSNTSKFRENISYDDLLKNAKKHYKSSRDRRSPPKINNNFYSFRDVEFDEARTRVSEKNLKMKNYYDFRVRNDFEPVISQKNRLDIDLRQHRLENTRKLTEFKKIKLLDLL